MNDISAPDNIVWPDELSAQSFLDLYWQKKPLLFRQAFPGFQSPITPDELAGLSLDEETTPRLITQDSNGHFELEHGPFDEDRFESLTGNDWSLLVTDVEKHCPDLLAYLQPFQFIPNWRIDDLMISYAPEGASVGAHVDEYDVFLLQASGIREWQIDSSTNPDLSVVPGATLKVLANFSANETHQLQPGDMLYLPPGVPHHGIAASDNCTTWSIGFRAPALSDVIVNFAELIAEKMGTSRYTDPMLSVASPGALDQQTLEAFANLWKNAVDLTDAELAALTAKTLTTPAVDIDRPVYQTEQVSLYTWKKHPFSRFTYLNTAGFDTAGIDEQRSQSVAHSTLDSQASHNLDDNSHDVAFFADGQQFICSRAMAIALCANESIISDDLTHKDKQVLNALVLNASVCPDD